MYCFFEFFSFIAKSLHAYGLIDLLLVSSHVWKKMASQIFIHFDF